MLGINFHFLIHSVLDLQQIAIWYIAIVEFLNSKSSPILQTPSYLFSKQFYQTLLS